jgi:hypothetical protein
VRGSPTTVSKTLNPIQAKIKPALLILNLNKSKHKIFLIIKTIA